jgi:hypothetical protein
MSRKPSTDWKSLHRFVGGDPPSVYVRTGEGTIDLSDKDPVHIAVVFDVQGFSGHSASIYVDQNRYHASVDTALQEAFSMLEQREIDANPDYVAELMEEWGDEWTDILTETFDARTWTLQPEDAARAIRGTPAALWIDIYDEDGEVEEDDAEDGKAPRKAFDGNRK